jgi:hypothetical protein
MKRGTGHSSIGPYSPECVEGEFSEVRILLDGLADTLSKVSESVDPKHQGELDGNCGHRRERTRHLS